MEEQQSAAPAPQESSSSKKQETGNKNLRAFLLGIGVLVLLVIVGIGGYTWNKVQQLSTDPFVLQVADVMGIAVAEVNGTEVKYTDYVDDLRVLSLFYEESPEGFPPTTQDQISDQVLSRLIANVVVDEVASELGVEVTEEEMQEARDALLSRFPDEQTATDELASRYGWSLETYMEKVVYPLILEENIREVFDAGEFDAGEGFSQEQLRASHILFQVGEGDDTESVRAEAQTVLERIQAGEDFAALAAEFGSDGTSQSGGDLGWFGRGVMVPDFEAAVFALEVGELSSELVQTQFGFHIIQLNDKRETVDFTSYMNSRLDESEIEVLLPVHNPFEEAEDAMIDHS